MPDPPTDADNASAELALEAAALRREAAELLRRSRWWRDERRLELLRSRRWQPDRPPPGAPGPPGPHA